MVNGMGLFSGKKQKKDFDILSGKGLIDFVRSNLENPTDEKVLKTVQEITKPDVDQEHLTKEGTLPWGWHRLNKDFTDNIQSEYGYFLNEWIAVRNLAPIKQYGTLKSFVMYLNDAQRLCYSKGECFAYWFDEIIANEEYILARTAELKELEQNIDLLQGQYEKRQKEITDIDSKIINKLKENQGILQSDFVKMFDESVQNDVKEKLYFWEKAGKIERIKSGRSYILHAK